MKSATDLRFKYRRTGTAVKRRVSCIKSNLFRNAAHSNALNTIWELGSSESSAASCDSGLAVNLELGRIKFWVKKIRDQHTSDGISRS